VALRVSVKNPRPHRMLSSRSVAVIVSRLPFASTKKHQLMQDAKLHSQEWLCHKYAFRRREVPMIAPAFWGRCCARRLRGPAAELLSSRPSAEH
jgi:hypothetical protein